MSIPYLKVEPEKAVSVLEKYIIKGYRIKISISKEYSLMKDSGKWGNNSSTIKTIANWHQWADGWTNKCVNEMFKIFFSSRECYNFIDAQPSFGTTSEDVRYISILNHLRARIDFLNKQTEFIFQQFNIKFSVQAGRDANLQIGGKNNKQEIKNER